MLMAFSSLFLGLSVILGAVGSHAISKYITTKDLEIFNKANFYLSTQSLALLVLILVNITTKLRIIPYGIYTLMGGMLLFCLALYMVSISGFEGFVSLRKFSILAPFGGAGMIAGWAIITCGLFRQKRI